jgi:hypothetical protein
MTYPTGSGTITNQWGPALPTVNGGDAPVYPPTATPSATGSLAPPQSPSGSVTGQSAPFNFAHTITSTQEFLTNVELDDAQQGTPAINAPCSFNSLNAATFQTFRWE